MKKTKVGRLLDSEKQIEILFDTNGNSICTNVHNAYKVTGIPDTYLVFKEEVSRYFIKRRNKRQITSKDDTEDFSIA